MKNTILIILSLCSLIVFSQDNFKLYYEETDDGFVILADNDEYSPVSAKMNFTLENLKSSNGNNKVFVVPAMTKRHIITNLSVIDRKKRVKLGYESVYNHGDHNQKEYDKDFNYYLPYGKGNTFWLSQGYNGATSHKNENALDFKMPMGTKIYAARGGVVIDVEESNSKSCTTPECAKLNNFILVYHSDGTFAEYTHIQKGGAKVTVGDQVKIGQLIGYSGDVGWATGPHLHFIVFLQELKDRVTLKTKFLIDTGKKAILLSEKEQYTRAY
ncbi:M23 family peptidase [Aquimarina sp. AD10]|uniref:M23 family metallopeptidase n=1 Tax=Aquimarina sp. AD10 TaxID=1714849 RepID=UPI000E4A4625|nr:M23 family metallopeptidase [Aquimarina sp. AD10]AXT60723.1 M23 family peptidase [Aquimarina sp. AD10]RKM95750.1 M23 family metallopeptidase [Aquimarina sp. AD10]